MDNYFMPDDDRVDGPDKVTGKASYAAEYFPEGMLYAVFATSTITRGRIRSINTRAAENAPGVQAVITHLNAMQVPGWEPAPELNKVTHQNRPLRLLYDGYVYYNGQPIAMAVADTFERATYAASLITAAYDEEQFETNLEKNTGRAVRPGNRADYVRGEADAFRNAPVHIEAEYLIPAEMHNPMELHAITAVWTGENNLKVYTKTQGVKSSQRALMQAFKLPEANVQVTAAFVGGGFGSALRTWPHEIAAVMAARKLNRPIRLVLTRADMFTSVGHRPRTIQKIGIGTNKEGVLTGITHEATGQTSSYEQFTEGVVNMTRFLYACPNVNTIYKTVALDIGTPTWMRGPGEATGAFALECGIDEMAYAIGMDPLDLRKKNYAETDPEKNKPFSSKFLRECYELGAEKIGWYQRNPAPRSMQENDWLVGYGMSTGTFNAGRGKAAVRAIFRPNGTLVLESAVSDSGPGTATAMTEIAARALGIPAAAIVFNLGESDLPPGPTQGGSTTTSTLGSAVYEVCEALKNELIKMAGPLLKNTSGELMKFSATGIVIPGNELVTYSSIFANAGQQQLELTQESQASGAQGNYSIYSYSVHFVKVHVHPRTGVVRVKQVVSVADAGKIMSEKTARSQMIGGVTGGIGMALSEEAIMDHRFGRYVNNNFADYHVAVNADVPKVDVYFINQPDPVLNPMGAKGMGEIALIGFAAAVANAVYHATGKRIRDLPITPDKVMA